MRTSGSFSSPHPSSASAGAGAGSGTPTRMGVMMKRANSLTSSLKDKLVEATAATATAAAAAASGSPLQALVPPRTNKARDAALLDAKERKLLMDNMKGLLVHLRVRVFMERQGNNKVTLFAPGVSTAERLADARAIAGIIERDGPTRMVDSLQTFTPATLAGVVKLAFQSSDAPLIPANVCGEIVFLQQESARQGKELDVEALREALGKASARSIDHLGQLCALLSTDDTPAQSLSYQWGPLLFLPRFDHKSAATKEYERMDIMSATPSVVAATRYMIEKVVDVFFLDDDDAIARKAEDLAKRLMAATVAAVPLASGGAHASASASASASEAGSKNNIRTSSSTNSLSNKSKRPELFKAVYAFAAETPEEINFEEGEIIAVFDKADDGWWTGRNERGEEGLFPGTYVEAFQGSMKHEIPVAEAEAHAEEEDAQAAYDEPVASTHEEEEEYKEENVNANSASVGGGGKAATEDRLAALERMLMEEREARRRAEEALKGTTPTASASANKTLLAPTPAPTSTAAPTTPKPGVNALQAALAARQAKMAAAAAASATATTASE